MTQRDELLITALYERLSRDDDQQGDSNSIVNTVRRIYELASSGASQLTICRTMVKEERVTPGYYRAQREPNGFGAQFSGQHPYHWSNRIIQQIVKRREYLGETVNFKTCYPDLRAKQIENPPEKWLCFPGTHEAIVDEVTWKAAQRIYHPNMSSKPGKSCKLTGLVICGECGVPMMFHRNNRNEKCNDFMCRSHQRSAGYDERQCTRNGIQVAVIRQIVRDVLCAVNRYAITDEEDFRRRLEQEATTQQPDDRKQLAKSIREKEKRIAQLEHLLKKLYEDYALGRITEERFDLLSTQYEQEEAALKAELADEQTQLNAMQSTAAQTDKYLALARKYRDCTEVTDEMILAFVEKIVVHKTIRPAKGQRTRQIEVHLNYIGQFPIPTDAEGIYPTGLMAMDTKPYFDGDILEYNGMWYRIGEGHKAFNPDKTADEDFYILTLASIASELSTEQITEANVYLALGLTTTWTGRQREDYRRYMMRSPDVRFTFNDIPYSMENPQSLHN